MKILKRICLFISAFVILAAGKAFAANSPDEAAKFFDDIGIIRSYTDGEYRGDDKVTRGEFCEYIVKCMNKGEYVCAAVLPFEDVKNGSVGYNAIGYLYENGVISYDTAFRPDDFISSNEAIKLIISALGYEKQAEIFGGYPIGYVKAASSVGLKTGFSSEMTKTAAASMLYSGINVRMAKYGMGDYGVEYSAGGNKDTWLYKYLGLQKKNGTVTESQSSSMTFSVGFNSESIKIDGMEYKSALADINDYFGCDVIYFEGTDDSENAGHILSIYTESKKIKVSADDISSADTNVFSYYENNKTITKRIDSNAKILYNGLPDTSFDVNNDFPMEKNGYVILIDNNDDSYFDVVSVWKFENRQVMAYSSANEQIVFKDQSVKVYDENKCRIFSKDLSMEQPTSLSENLVLSIAETKNSERTIYVMSGDCVTGTVSYVSDDEIKIEDNIYKIHENLKGDIKASSAGTFYFDFMGNVAFVISEGTEKYGYLMNLYLNEDIEKYAAKIFCDSGKAEIYTLKDKVNFSGDGSLEGTRKDDKDIRSAFLDTNGEFQKQLIRYRVGVDGEISKIIKAYEYNDYSFDSGSYLKNWGVTDRFILNGKASGKTRYYETAIFNSGVDDAYCTYWIDPTRASVFYISNDDSKCQYGKLFDSVIKTTDSMNLPTIKVYGVDEYGYADIVVFESTSKIKSTFNLGQSINYLAITKTNVCYDEELEEIVIKLTGYNKTGGEVSITCEDGALMNVGSTTISSVDEDTVRADELKAGDVIMYTTNSQNILTDFMIFFRGGYFKEYKYLAGAYHGYIFSGYIGKSNNVAYTFTDDDGNILRSTPWTPTNVLVTVYDTKTGRLEKGEKSDIYPGCKICMVGGVNTRFTFAMVIK